MGFNKVPSFSMENLKNGMRKFNLTLDSPTWEGIQCKYETVGEKTCKEEAVSCNPTKISLPQGFEMTLM